MARRVFFSFYFDEDYWRTQQVRQMGAIEGQKILNANAWEEVRKKGDAAIQAWIDEELKGKSCVVVLVGAATASRPWVQYEISKGWNESKGVLAVRINKLLNKDGYPASAGENPLTRVSFKNTSKTVADVAKLKDPAGTDSKSVYASIASNIEAWVEEAIQIRENFRGW